jgi:hypothetical protein
MVKSQSSAPASMGSSSHSTALATSTRYPDLEEGRQYPSKLIRLAGDVRLASVKARNRLGSEMSAQQRRDMLKSDKEVAARRRKEMRNQLILAINQPPSTSQLLLPASVVGPVAAKALLVFGDDLLSILSLRQLPVHAKVTPKVLKIFGPEPGLIPPKARSLMMGTSDQLPAVVDDSAYKRQRRSSYESLSALLANAFGALRDATTSVQ